MSKLGFFNYYFFQFFFIRLAQVSDDDDKIIGYKIMYGVYPFTGWNSNYKFTKKHGYSKLLPWGKK